MKGAKRHGKGRYMYNKNSFYDGNWTDDKRNGKGIYVDSSLNYMWQYLN